MANRQPSRKIAVRSDDWIRWERRFNRVFFGFLILNLCVLLATWNAPPIVHKIMGPAFVLGLVGLIGVGTVRGVKPWRHFHLVFTIHWTQPKEVGFALTKLWYRQLGVATCLRESTFVGLVISGPLALLWLLQWATFKMDPGKYTPPFAEVWVIILFLGCGAFPSLGSLLDARFSSKTVGFDKEWMGYLQGKPGKALWRYEQIARVRFESLRVGEREFRLMVAVPREGREVAFGLSDEVDERRITDFLADKGVEVSHV